MRNVITAGTRKIVIPNFGPVIPARPGGPAVAWDPSQPTDDGGVSAHTIHDPESGAVYQDDAETTLVASDGDVVGSSVSQGTDGHSIVQATTGAKPKWRTDVLNGHAVFEFDGIDDMLEGSFSGGNLSLPVTAFVVAQLDASIVSDGNFHRLITDNNSDRIIIQKRNDDNWGLYNGAHLTGGAADSDWNIWCVLFNGASSQFWLNGTSEASGDAGAFVADGLVIGSGHAGGLPWLGYVAYHIIYPSNLSNADKNQAGGFLATRFGLTWSDIT